MTDSTPRELCLHQLFEHQALLTPDATAVLLRDRQLTYAELNSQANRLARYLRSCGARLEDRIAVCADRTELMVAALLGCLKAGCTYLPFDPTYPVGYTLTLLKAAQPALVLVDGPARMAIEKEYGGFARLVELESCASQSAQLPAEDLDSDALGLSSRNLAYVIYTSGSTGAPKGVMIEHRSVVNLISMLQRIWRVYEIRRSLQFFSNSFDASVKEIFFALSTGATLVLRTNEWIADARTFWRLCGQYDLNYVNLPSRFWQAIIRDGSVEIPSCVRLVVFGGESIDKTALTNWFSRRGHRPTLVNAYGPTEATINTAINEVVDVQDWRTVGRPVDDVEIYILDSALERLPVGMTGEIYIAGTGLARGYLNDPELTVQRFQRNPFSPDRAARMYRSGDLGCWCDDGRIDLFGRIDSQVKIRGFRVELSEIQAHIIGQPEISDAVVITRSNEGQNPRLVAYIVAAGGKRLFSTEHLRKMLLASLPEYKVPAAYVVLDSLPLLPNGKIDRRALPAPDRSAYVESNYEEPTGHMEETIAGIWRELLALEQVGRCDNFFALGGDSLSAVELAMRLQQEVGPHIDACIILASPTLRDLAEVASRTNPDFQDRFDADKECVLDPAIGPFPKRSAVTDVGGIFLTGASGFLGGFLLVSLLKQTDKRIYCLVRCANEVDGMRRICDNLDSYGLRNAELERRVVVISGDLTKPNLGLKGEQFSRLAEAVDIVYHNAAWVHALHNYTTLKPVNVAGTIELIKLAQLGRAKELHFVSSLDVLPVIKLLQIGVRGNSNQLFYGYGQSKWIAERLLHEATLRGMRVAIYRPTYISGYTRNGATNADDLLSRFIHACLEIGYVPDLDFGINMLPVDYVSDVIVQLSTKTDCDSRVYNLVHPHSVNISTLILQLRSGRGLAKISLEAWFEHCRDNRRTRALSTLLPQASISTTLMRCSHVDEGDSSYCIDTEWNYPAMDDSLLSKYVQWGCARHEESGLA